MRARRITSRRYKVVSMDYPLTRGPDAGPVDSFRPAQRMRGVLVTETRDDTVTWLTQEAYDRLKAELDHLSGEGRIDIAKKIEAARDEGDLRENGGFHPATDEPGQRQGRNTTPHPPPPHPPLAPPAPPPTLAPPP